MKNVELTLGANILTIKVDLTKEFGPSSSGKTIIIASTEGNVGIPGAEDKKIYKEFTPERATLAIVKSKEVIAWIKIEFAK